MIKIHCSQLYLRFLLWLMKKEDEQCLYFCPWTVSVGIGLWCVHWELSSPHIINFLLLAYRSVFPLWVGALILMDTDDQLMLGVECSQWENKYSVGLTLEHKRDHQNLTCASDLACSKIEHYYFSTLLWLKLKTLIGLHTQSPHPLSTNFLRGSRPSRRIRFDMWLF